MGTNFYSSSFTNGGSKVVGTLKGAGIKHLYIESNHVSGEGNNLIGMTKITYWDTSSKARD